MPAMRIKQDERSAASAEVRQHFDERARAKFGLDDEAIGLKQVRTVERERMTGGCVNRRTFSRCSRRATERVR
jgi:hypothetical protein